MRSGGPKSWFSANSTVVHILVLKVQGCQVTIEWNLDYIGIGSKSRFGTFWASRVMLRTWFSWTPRVLTLVGIKTMRDLIQPAMNISACHNLGFDPFPKYPGYHSIFALKESFPSIPHFHYLTVFRCSDYGPSFHIQIWSTQKQNQYWKLANVNLMKFG